MSYTPTNWVNGSTPVSQGNMNNIENWIAAADAALSIDTTNHKALEVLLTTGKIKRIAKGNGSANATITHNWGETADIVLAYYNGSFGSPPTQAIAIKNETTNSFDVVAETGYSWSVCYIKF